MEQQSTFRTGQQKSPVDVRLEERFSETVFALASVLRTPLRRRRRTDSNDALGPDMDQNAA